MPNTYRGRPTLPRSPIVLILTILIAVLAIADIAVISLCLRTPKKEDTPKPTASPATLMAVCMRYFSRLRQAIFR